MPNMTGLQLLEASCEQRRQGDIRLHHHRGDARHARQGHRCRREISHLQTLHAGVVQRATRRPHSLIVTTEPNCHGHRLPLARRRKDSPDLGHAVRRTGRQARRHFRSDAGGRRLVRRVRRRCRRSPWRCAARMRILRRVSAARFSMLPVAAAKDAAKARELTDVMIENVREIMNICTRLVMDATSPHLKLDQIYPAKSLPAAARHCSAPARGGANFRCSCRNTAAACSPFCPRDPAARRAAVHAQDRRPHSR